MVRVTQAWSAVAVAFDVPNTPRTAVGRAAGALSLGAWRCVGRLATGEPSTWMSRCRSWSTWALTPLPKTETPLTLWVKLRWWVPPMST